MKRGKNKGFTLIELLVVITLIGILAIAVLSALNPIEQINKARDARKRADASQLLKAIDRYFASNERFPWNNYTAYNASVDVAFSGTGELVGAGLCDTAGGGTTGNEDASAAGGCAASGVLVTGQELKSQFGKRDYFKSAALPGDKLYVYKALNDPSVSVCFIPGSKAARDTADQPLITTLKDLGVGGTPTGPSQIIACAGDPDAIDWSDITDACYVCIPEE